MTITTETHGTVGSELKDQNIFENEGNEGIVAPKADHEASLSNWFEMLEFGIIGLHNRFAYSEWFEKEFVVESCDSNISRLLNLRLKLELIGLLPSEKTKTQLESCLGNYNERDLFEPLYITDAVFHTLTFLFLDSELEDKDEVVKMSCDITDIFRNLCERLNAMGAISNEEFSLLSSWNEVDDYARLKSNEQS